MVITAAFVVLRQFPNITGFKCRSSTILDLGSLGAKPREWGKLPNFVPMTPVTPTTITIMTLFYHMLFNGIG